MGMAQGAHAQLIQQYFPSDIPGYSPDLSSSVVVRMLNQDQSQGIEDGDFVIRPQISENTGYRSDILGTPNSGSSELDSNAGVKINSDWGRDAIGGSFTVDNQEYPELPSANFTNWTAGIGGALTLGNDTATIGYSHLALHLNATDLGVSGVVTPVPYSVDDVRLSYLKLLSRFSVTPSFEYENFSFGQSSGALSVNDNTLSHQTESEGISTLYELSPGNNANVILRISQSQFKTSPDNDYVDAGGFVGLDFRGDSVVQYRALGGFESRRFSSGVTRTVNTPTFELDAVWTPTRLDTVTATGFRELDDPTSAFALNQTITTGRLELDHELRANVFLRADAGAGESVSQSSIPGFGADKQRQLSFGVSAFWNINRNMRGTLSYGYTSGVASGPNNNTANGSGFANFSSNSISIGISLFE
jgi:hypothetical protein